MLRPITIVRILRIGLLTLLLCGIVASELPDLLSLTDNSANDFTMRSQDSLVPSVLNSARSVRKASIDLNTSTQDLPFRGPSTLEKKALAPSLHFVLYSILRT
jgi:hypothetical protein